MTDRFEVKGSRNEVAGAGEDDGALPDSGWRLRPASLTPESADPLLGALLALCRLHGRPRSAASLTSGLAL